MNLEPGISPGSPSSLHLANQRRVLMTLIDAGGISQAEISRRTGLAPATVSNIVRELVNAEVLCLIEAASGRRGNTIAFSPSIGYAMGISIEREFIRLGLATLDQSVVETASVEMAAGYDARRGFEKAYRLYQDLLEKQGINQSQVVAGCMAVANSVTPDGTLTSASTVLPGWADINIPREGSRIFKLPMTAENDANAGVLAEHLYGRGQGHQNLVYIEASYGVGAGLLLGGEVYTGTFGSAGEIGHLPVPGAKELCQCANHGCLETVAGVPHLMRQLQNLHLPVQDFSQVMRLAERGDNRCLRLLRESGEALGYVLTSICNLFNPSMIIIGGVFAQAGDYVIGPLRHELERRAFPDSVAQLEITTAALGAQAPLRGAMAKAVNMVDLDQILVRQGLA